MVDVVKANNLIEKVRMIKRNDKDFIDLANLYIEIFDMIMSRFKNYLPVSVDEDDILQLYYIDLYKEVIRRPCPDPYELFDRVYSSLSLDVRNIINDMMEDNDALDIYQLSLILSMIDKMDLNRIEKYDLADTIDHILQDIKSSDRNKDMFSEYYQLYNYDEIKTLKEVGKDHGNISTEQTRQCIHKILRQIRTFNNISKGRCYNLKLYY